MTVEHRRADHGKWRGGADHPPFDDQDGFIDEAPVRATGPAKVRHGDKPSTGFPFGIAIRGCAVANRSPAFPVAQVFKSDCCAIAQY